MKKFILAFLLIGGTAFGQNWQWYRSSDSTITPLGGMGIYLPSAPFNLHGGMVLSTKDSNSIFATPYYVEQRGADSSVYQTVFRSDSLNGLTVKYSDSTIAFATPSQLAQKIGFSDTSSTIATQAYVLAHSTAGADTAYVDSVAQLYDSRSKSQVYATAGTYTFVVPTGVTEIWVTAVGAGGAGGGGVISSSIGSGGGGGAGEYILHFPIHVYPSKQIQIYVGPGGDGAPGLPGTAGGADTIGTYSDTIYAVVHGGFGGDTSLSTGAVGGAGGGFSGGAGGQINSVGSNGSEYAPFLFGGAGGSGGSNTYSYVAGGQTFFVSPGAYDGSHVPGGGGASSWFAPGGAGGLSANGGSGRQGSGGGGAPGRFGGLSGNLAGGSGGAGYVLIEWISN